MHEVEYKGSRHDLVRSDESRQRRSSVAPSPKRVPCSRQQPHEEGQNKDDAVSKGLVEPIKEVLHLLAGQAVVDFLRDVSLKIFRDVGATDVEILAELENAKDSVLQDQENQKDVVVVEFRL